MYGVSKITTAENIMLIHFSAVSPAFMAQTLAALAQADVVVDMISQTAPSGSGIRFSFTADYSYLDTAVKTVGGKGGASPMFSGGYTKINLFGEEMVESVGVAARALDALMQQNIEIVMITTSDLDISLLVRREDADIALEMLQKAFEIDSP